MNGNNSDQKKQGTSGFALLDDDGHILAANNGFGTLLNIDTGQSQLTLAQQLKTRFTSNVGNLEEAFSTTKGCLLDIQSTENTRFHVHIAPLENGRRIVVIGLTDPEQSLANDF